MDITLFISRLTVQRLRNSNYNMSVLPMVGVVIGEYYCISFNISESISVAFLTMVVVQKIVDFFVDWKEKNLGNPFSSVGLFN
jgi:hypothetical protein